jgi:hypothetical protein
MRYFCLFFDDTRTVLKLTSVVVLADNTDEQGVVDDLMFLEKLCVFAYDLKKFGALALLQVDGWSLFEVVVFLGGGGVGIVSSSADPGAFEVIAFNDLLLGVEDVGHDDEVAAVDLIAFLVLLDEFVQAVEFDDHGFGVLLEVVVVVLEYVLQQFVLALAHRFEHVLSVGGVVEETAALALAGQRSHGVYLAHHQGGHEAVGPDAADVLFVVDLEEFADVVEGVGGVVREGVDGGGVLLISEPSGDQFEIVLESEIFGFFVDHLLEAAYAPHCHLDADHHVEDEVPVVVANEDHVAFVLVGAFMHVFDRLELALLDVVLRGLEFLAEGLVDCSRLLHDALEFLADETELFLEGN